MSAKFIQKPVCGAAQRENLIIKPKTFHSRPIFFIHFMQIYIQEDSSKCKFEVRTVQLYRNNRLMSSTLFYMIYSCKFAKILSIDPFSINSFRCSQNSILFLRQRKMLLVESNAISSRNPFGLIEFFS